MTFLIKTDPWTRVDDRFSFGKDINCLPPTCDQTHPLIPAPSTDLQSQYQPKFYQHFAMDVVAESVFHYPYPFVTEKTFRAIACKRMFVLVSSQHSLQLLQQKGFHTWGDIIDESYDSISDPQARFLAVVASIKQFCALPIETIKTYMLDNQQKFQENFAALKDLKQRELEKIQQQLKGQH